METSVHHTFWNRAWYRTPVLRALRNHTLVKTALYVPAHRELHAQLPPPPKPNPEMAIGAVILLDELKNDGDTNPVDAHLALSEYFLQMDSALGGRIGHHILKQTGFIMEGMACEAES